MQGEGLTSEGSYHLLLLHKQTNDKRHNAESLHEYKTRARLTVYEVGVFFREISQLLKICPFPFLWSYLNSLPMSVFLRDYSEPLLLSTTETKIATQIGLTLD